MWYIASQAIPLHISMGWVDVAYRLSILQLETLHSLVGRQLCKDREDMLLPACRQDSCRR